MSENQAFTFISIQAPYGTDGARACLDMVLAFSVFEQPINYLFYQDGVYQLLDSQQDPGKNEKILSASFKALELYGVTNVFVHAESLALRGLTAADLALPVKLLDTQSMSRLIGDSRCVFTI